VAVAELYDTGTYERVYNLAIRSFHTYFVCDETWPGSVWAHNACGPGNNLRFSRDQDALIQLAKELKRKGVSTKDVGILRQWAREYGLSFRGPESHPGRKFGEVLHIHIGPINHILVIP
jgi:hypothetical protein